MDKHIKAEEKTIMGKPEQHSLTRQTFKFTEVIKGQSRERVGNNYERVAW